jgi:uncharacterized protein
MRSLHAAWDNEPKIVIGMLHLPALSGSPLSRLKLSQIRDHVRGDVDALVEGGVHGLMMENFGDVPFYPDRVPAYVIAQMTAIASDVRSRSSLPLGINVLRNDGRGALAIAHATGADFIRVNVLCGARVADQGLIQGIAHDLLRERTLLGASDVRIFADVDVKHSAPLAERDLEDEVDDVARRALADAVIVSGAGTGKKTDPAKARRVKAAAPDLPLFIGSGTTAETIRDFVGIADGFIVGTSLKVDGVASNPVEMVRVKALVEKLRG